MFALNSIFSSSQNFRGRLDFWSRKAPGVEEKLSSPQAQVERGGKLCGHGIESRSPAGESWRQAECSELQTTSSWDTLHQLAIHSTRWASEYTQDTSATLLLGSVLLGSVGEVGWVKKGQSNADGRSCRFAASTLSVRFSARTS